jgi:hypothetical protein
MAEKRLSRSELNESLKSAANKLLIDYLEFYRLSDDQDMSLIDSSLAQVFAITKSKSQLKELLWKTNHCDIDYCNSALRDNGYHYFASLLFKQKQLHSKVLDIWVKLVTGELVDSEFPGIQTMVDYLKQLPDKELVLKYAASVLTRDAGRGVQIFIDRKDGIFEMNQVLDFLDSYGNTAKKKYLEYVVIKQNNQNVELQTELAGLYLHEVIRLSKKELLKELDTIYQVYDTRSQISFVEFLGKRGDPLCRARLQFYDFVMQYSVQTQSLYELLTDKHSELYIERVAILIQVSLDSCRCKTLMRYWKYLFKKSMIQSEH